MQCSDVKPLRIGLWRSRSYTPGNVLSSGSPPLVGKPVTPQSCLRHKTKNQQGSGRGAPGCPEVTRKRWQPAQTARDRALLAGVQVEGSPALISNQQAGEWRGAVLTPGSSREERSTRQMLQAKGSPCQGGLHQNHPAAASTLLTGRAVYFTE